MRSDSLNRLAVVALCLVALQGCGDGPGSAPAAEAISRTLQPQDAVLAGIYQRSCASCHTVAATSAPLAGDTAAWEPRLAKGMPVLVDNIVNGFAGMPPFGLCMDCDAAQFAALTLFMATGE